MSLAPEVVAAATEALLELMPAWLSIPLSDHRRLLRPTGPGNYSIHIEPYRGVRTWIAFEPYLQSSPAVQRFRAAIAVSQPELGGYLLLPGRSMHLGDSNALLSAWCRALEVRVQQHPDLQHSIQQLLSDVANLLDERLLTTRITTSIAGLRLPSSDFFVRLADGLTLRAMTDDELAELSSHDITHGRENDIMSHSVSSCLVFEAKSPFGLTRESPADLMASGAGEDARQYTTDLLRTLHILKPGRAGVFTAATEYKPDLLPWLGGGSSWPLYRPPFASLELAQDDVDSLLGLYAALRGGVRDEVRIAIDCLVDAEGRLSPVDSLMDAAIGLEALLNPMDAAELAFRVALNYAYLAEPGVRRERYERIRAIQKTRNRVVHGGLNVKSPDAPVIHQHAELAKACLRDSIKCFLLDRSLSGNRRLDAEFWLDRILPTNIV